ncbi:MAG: hypothetical protein MUC92_08620 [Fimbriimonadaceae bacterium]|jgi:YHS domain-containing protein|nr:hypothetical protein [Fimbriimonadaceae bacterium]
MTTQSTLASLFLSLALATSALAQEVVCPVAGGKPVASVPSVDFNGIQVGFCTEKCETSFRAGPTGFLAEALLNGATVGVFAFDPVDHQKVGVTPFVADFEGVRYFFRSEANREKFLSNPRVYASIPRSMSLTCPVMKNPVATPSRASGYADFEGVRYYFCCAGCEGKFAESPKKYSDEVADQVALAGLLSQKSGGGLNLAPTCAGCAGEAKVLGANGLPTQWTFSARFIASDDVAVRSRFTLDYRLAPNLTVGIERSGSDSQIMPTPAFGNDPIEYLRKSDGDAPLLPRLSWFITPETHATPSVVVGFTSDRLSTPRGQAFFTTFSKSLPDVPFTPFASVKYNNFDNSVKFPFGVNWRVDRDYALQLVNDGDNTHWLVTRLGSPVTVSLLFVRSREWGISFNVGF